MATRLATETAMRCVFIAFNFFFSNVVGCLVLNAASLGTELPLWKKSVTAVFMLGRGKKISNVFKTSRVRTSNSNINLRYTTFNLFLAEAARLSAGGAQTCSTEQLKMSTNYKSAHKYELNAAVYVCIARGLFSLSVYWLVLCQQMKCHLRIITQLSRIQRDKVDLYFLSC